jgi:hypothetical protein
MRCALALSIGLLLCAQGCGGGSGPGGGRDGGPDGCDNLECKQVVCDQGGTTSLAGKVYIPAGTLPLPNVIVFVPNRPLAPLPAEISCERCDEHLSGSPLVRTTTDYTGSFVLEDMPVGEEIPLVMQVGRWRRQVTLPAIEPCVENTLTGSDEAELLRLPKDRNEGDIPRIALTTGRADALECLLLKIGIDEQEITNASGGGRVHYYAGGGGTPRFAQDLHGGADFDEAVDFWSDLESLKNYDVVIFSCEGGLGRDNEDDAYKSAAAVTNVRDYANIGGRVFASHWHNWWIDDRGGHEDFQPVATWNRQSNPDDDTMIGYIDTSFTKGRMLADWLDYLGASPELGQIVINGARRTLQAVHAGAERWMYNDALNSTQNFSVNTPVAAPATQKCGRVVFSDMHVSDGDTSSSSTGFPDGCNTTELTAQEKALVFMMFDLAACVSVEVD